MDPGDQELLETIADTLALVIQSLARLERAARLRIAATPSEPAPRPRLVVMNGTGQN